MKKQAASIYREACEGSGENPAFTRAVSKLVGTTAKDLNALASRFAYEAEIMQRASEIARIRACADDIPVNAVTAALGGSPA